MTYLKTVGKSKKKTVLECQQWCAAAGAGYFKWKYHKKAGVYCVISYFLLQASKRLCWCQAVAYKTKKNFTSGPVTC